MSPCHRIFFFLLLTCVKVPSSYSTYTPIPFSKHGLLDNQQYWKANEFLHAILSIFNSFVPTRPLPSSLFFFSVLEHISPVISRWDFVGEMKVLSMSFLVNIWIFFLFSHLIWWIFLGGWKLYFNFISSYSSDYIIYAFKEFFSLPICNIPYFGNLETAFITT